LRPGDWGPWILKRIAVCRSAEALRQAREDRMRLLIAVVLLIAAPWPCPAQTPAATPPAATLSAGMQVAQL
jgi:hypothetical protein